jgi:hypothetical protein
VEVVGPGDNKASILAIIEAARSGKISDEELRQRLETLMGNPAFEDAVGEALNESAPPLSALGACC